MKRKNLIALIGIWACAIGLVLIVYPSHSEHAVQPPSEGCVAVSKLRSSPISSTVLQKTGITVQTRGDSPHSPPMIDEIRNAETHHLMQEAPEWRASPRHCSENP